jgi:tetratricopeptide (TPR) repeat protein
VQQSVTDYFKHSVSLIPKNLQLHVSSGAAINSLLYNAFDEKIIKPITNEALYLLVYKNGKEELYPIFQTGTSLPSHTMSIDNLIPREGADRLELPICLGSKENVIYNIVINNDGKHDSLTLEVLIDANRTIHCEANIGGICKKASIENTLLSVSTKKETIEKAEYDYSKRMSQRKGKEVEQDLYNLYKIYSDNGEYLKAATVAEELYKKHNKLSLHNIGFIYSEAGENDKAIYYYQKAVKEKPSAVSYFNLACEYLDTDKVKFEECLKEALVIDPSFSLADYELTSYQMHNGDREQAEIKLNSIFDRWKTLYDNDCFEYHHSWLISCAKAVGEYEFARKVFNDAAGKVDTVDGKYSDENLMTYKEF